jgi:uncharacterized damage-inducible protein DinB
MTTAELLQELEQESQSTRRVLERVPEDRLAWKPHEKSMSLGQLALHVATLPGGIAEVATQSAFDVKTSVPRPEAASVAEVMKAFDESLARARSVLGAMDDAALASTWRMVDGDRELMAIPRSALLRTIMLNHLYHHRGQLTVYLRETGVPLPAIYGSSADEQPFAKRD